MNCKEFEEYIYFYDELTDAEKESIADHHNQCGACRQLANEYFRVQHLLNITRAEKPAPQHPHQLTQRIMQEVVVKKGYSFIDALGFYLNSLFARYAVSVVSIFLITFFLYEQKAIHTNTSASKISTTAINKGTVLDLNKFRTSYVKQRESKQSSEVSKYTYFKSEHDQKSL